ncbi:probable cytosolic oligopeptidase A [Chelonus insularis]|uniref:probable cytosolic oligopeptidase A n=1 Tax=Chelonus insularis TaxID=460826 RepID=UPI00158E7A16|nr:probable cytosolic oligopeptidase A [Chelonus insularis]
MAVSFCANRIKFLASNILSKTWKRHTSGYIVLVPEIGEDMRDKDPLTKDDGFPEFNTFTVEKVMAVIGKQTILYEQEINNMVEIIKNKKDLDIVNDVINRLESSDVRLHSIWGIANVLYFGNQSIMPNRYYETVSLNLSKTRGHKYLNRTLHKVWQEALEDDDKNLTAEQKRIIEKNAREGRLNGLELSNSGYMRYYMDQSKIFKKTDEFRRKVGVATLIFKTKIIDPNVVKDFPEEFLKMTAEDPNNCQKGPWNITLEPIIVEKFLELCPSRELRWNVWQANVGRCSMLSDSSIHTSSLLEDIRTYRIEQAKLLGYKSYSHMSMETKIAPSLENVYQVMNSLLKIARPAQEKELAALTAFAKDEGWNIEIRPWDLDYWSRRYLRTVHNFKDEIFNEYFPLPHVLTNVFRFVEKLFNIRITEETKTDVWHSDVRFFDVYDLKESSNEPIAHFYLDPYARGRNKLNKSKSRAWTIPIQNRSKLMKKKPLIAMIFNFSPPKGEIPSLLSFNDVVVLFGEMGLALQSLLTKVEYSDLAGSSNVEWDAVGISYHLLSYWAYDPDVIKSISKHYKTEEPITSDMLNAIEKSKTHMAGYKLCERLYFSKLDLKLFELDEFWKPITDRLYKEHFVFPKDPKDSHITSWEDIFVNNYCAAYYSILWAKMLGADVHSAFQEIPKDHDDEIKKLAERFRDTFLAKGGSVSARELFRRFRGRDPNTMAYLKSLGFQTNIEMCENL